MIEVIKGNSILGKNKIVLALPFVYRDGERIATSEIPDRLETNHPPRSVRLNKIDGVYRWITLGHGSDIDLEPPSYTTAYEAIRALLDTSEYTLFVCDEFPAMVTACRVYTMTSSWAPEDKEGIEVLDTVPDYEVIALSELENDDIESTEYVFGVLGGGVFIYSQTFNSWIFPNGTSVSEFSVAGPRGAIEDLLNKGGSVYLSDIYDDVAQAIRDHE